MRLTSGISGSGVCKLEYDLGAAYDTVHMTMTVYWESGWDPHSISEKIIWLNDTGSPNPLLETLNLNFAILYITEATGCSKLGVNQAGTGSAGRTGNCSSHQTWKITDFDGQWVTIEWLIIQNAAGNDGTIKLWQDGTLLMEHTGRTFDQAEAFKMWDTYGGAGDPASQDQSRLIARWRIARSAS